MLVVLSLLFVYCSVFLSLLFLCLVVVRCFVVDVSLLYLFAVLSLSFLCLVVAAAAAAAVVVVVVWSIGWAAE